jgi:hypothetical protein
MVAGYVYSICTLLLFNTVMVQNLCFFFASLVCGGRAVQDT